MKKKKLKNRIKYKILLLISLVYFASEIFACVNTINTLGILFTSSKTTAKIVCTSHSKVVYTKNGFILKHHPVKTYVFCKLNHPVLNETTVVAECILPPNDLKTNSKYTLYNVGSTYFVLNKPLSIICCLYALTPLIITFLNIKLKQYKRKNKRKQSRIVNKPRNYTKEHTQKVS